MYCLDGTLKNRTNQELNRKFKMVSPAKVSHVGKQPTGLDRGPGIGLTGFHGDTNNNYNK